jgi:hypothetical protein
VGFLGLGARSEPILFTITLSSRGRFEGGPAALSSPPSSIVEAIASAAVKIVTAVFEETVLLDNY